jgi:hypothetical protein
LSDYKKEDWNEKNPPKFKPFRKDKMCCKCGNIKPQRGVKSKGSPI